MLRIRSSLKKSASSTGRREHHCASFRLVYKQDSLEQIGKRWALCNHLLHTVLCKDENSMTKVH